MRVLYNTDETFEKTWRDYKSSTIQDLLGQIQFAGERVQRTVRHRFRISCRVSKKSAISMSKSPGMRRPCALYSETTPLFMPEVILGVFLGIMRKGIPVARSNGQEKGAHGRCQNLNKLRFPIVFVPRSLVPYRKFDRWAPQC